MDPAGSTQDENLCTTVMVNLAEQNVAGLLNGTDESAKYSSAQNTRKILTKRSINLSCV
jgi:hypothetical protein